MVQLVAKVESINEDFNNAYQRIKPVERRLDTLAQHLALYESYEKHKAVYKKYKQLSGKKAEACYDKHFEETQAFETAGSISEMC